jgi:hypothetical protein
MRAGFDDQLRRVTKMLKRWVEGSWRQPDLLRDHRSEGEADAL